MKPIIASRNQREGRYAGWRVTGGRNSLNWQCRPINHERSGNGKAASLKGWERLRKAGHA